MVIHSLYVCCVAHAGQIWRDSTTNSQWQWTPWNSKITPTERRFNQLPKKGESAVAMWMVDMMWPGTEWCAQLRAIKVASRLGHMV